MSDLDPRAVGAPLLAAAGARRPSPEELLRQLQQRQQTNIDAQRAAAEQTQARLGELREQKPSMVNPLALAALSDAFTGSNLTPIAKTLAPEDPKKEIGRLENLLARQQGAITDDEMAMLRAQMQQAQAATQEPEMTFAEKQDLLQKNKMDYLKQQFDLSKQLQQFKAKQREPKKVEGGPDLANLTKGQIAADKKFAGEYQNWVAGGFSNVQTNLDKLEGTIKRLGEKDQLGENRMPEFARAIYSPETVAVEQDVADVVFQSLKAILGGQFSEREGQKLMQNTYDSRLPDETNVRKVSALKEKIKRAAKAKQDASAYFEKYGSLKGFKGSTAASMAEFDKNLKKEIFGEESKKTRKQILEEKYGL